MFAMKKGSSIGNSLVRNKVLSAVSPVINGFTQKCNATGCLQCPLANPEHELSINNNKLTILTKFNCKTRNVIYLWKCNLCPKNQYYFGRTTQKCHERTNGHRGCFNDTKWENSALSMHSKGLHE